MGVNPRRLVCDQTDTLPAASAAELVPNVLGFLSFEAYQQHREGDPYAWATQVLHIICPGLHTGEDTPASPHGVDTTREAAVRPFIWRTGDREKTNRTTPTTLQRRMQARPPGTWHKHRLLEKLLPQTEMP